MGHYHGRRHHAAPPHGRPPQPADRGALLLTGLPLLDGALFFFLCLRFSLLFIRWLLSAGQSETLRRSLCRAFARLKAIAQQRSRAVFVQNQAPDCIRGRLSTLQIRSGPHTPTASASVSKAGRSKAGSKGNSAVEGPVPSSHSLSTASAGTRPAHATRVCCGVVLILASVP